MDFIAYIYINITTVMNDNKNIYLSPTRPSTYLQ